MSKFKVGDKVRVLRVENSWNASRPAQSAIDMVGNEYIVSHVHDDKDVRLEGTLWHWSVLDIELVNEHSFIDKVIGGETVEYPNTPFKNGKFIGYAIEFTTRDMHQRPLQCMSIVTNDGETVDTNNLVRCDATRQKLQIQEEPPKVLMHSVAYIPKYCVLDHHWCSVMLSDVDLDIRKSEWVAYKILETWYK